ncbi:hypothetical protein CR513_54637, partial [Mucuna pruriens]
MTQELIKEMRQQMRDELKSIGLSQLQITMQPTSQEFRRLSTNGSCAAPDPLGEDTHTDILDYYELYIDEGPLEKV